MKIIKLSATKSTNDYIHSFSKEIAVEDELVVVANDQTNGRGQRGSGWFSEPLNSLTFSVLKKFKTLHVKHAIIINWGVSLAIKAALEDVGVPNVHIKWPNDILAGMMKVCGILIENRIVNAKIDSAVIGVGINVNNTVFPNLPKATSMSLSTGKEYLLSEVLDEVCDKIILELNRIDENSFLDVKTRYENALFKRNEISVFENNDGTRFNGVILGVTHSGELKLKTDNGELLFFELKQIKLLY